MIFTIIFPKWSFGNHHSICTKRAWKSWSLVSVWIVRFGQVNNFLHFIHLILVNSFNCTNQSNPCYSLLYNNLFSLFTLFIFDFHCKLIYFIDKSNNHHCFRFSFRHSWNMIISFLSKHVPHNFKGLFFFELVFLFCHKIIEVNIFTEWIKFK